MNSMFPFVGRSKEKGIIKKAIENHGQLHILLLIGERGIGKTWLLNQVPTLLPEPANKSPYRYGEPIDLYHTPYHRSSGIEETIRKIVDPNNKGFAKYEEKREEYGRHRLAGMGAKELEKERAELEDYFLDNFNALTSNGIRPILCFDTLELMQYESDRVQELCDLDPTRDIGRIETRSWLLNNIPRMKNTVVILAGRPHPQRLWTDLAHAFREAVVEKIEPKDLSPDDAVEYFHLLAAQDEAIREAALTKETAQEFCRLTEGRPLRLGQVALLLKERAYLAEDLVNLLGGVQVKTGQTAGDALDEILSREIQGIRRDVDIALPYIAWARKGIDAELLHLLLSQRVSSTQWPLSRCRGVLKYLKTFFPFVKIRPGTDLLFLHDQMYDLMEKTALFGREDERTQACQLIVNDYYQPKIEKARHRRKQELLAEQLYYRFLANPWEGYTEYARLSDEAIIGHEAGFDMSLREEVLRFCKTDYPARARDNGLTSEFLDRDATVRWVRRYIAGGGYQKAIQVATQIAKSSLYDPGDTLFTAALATYQGEAMAYLHDPQAVEQLKKAIDLLQPVYPAPDNFRGTKDKAYLLGRAYNDLGFIYQRTMQYQEAVEANSQALRQYRAFQRYLENRLGEGTRLFDIEWERANTEKNLAYVYGLQGELMDADNLCKESKNRFQRLGQRYGLALALNVRGLLHILDDQPHRGRTCCRQALRMLEELEDQHGIGMACIGLGRCLRKLGRLDTYAEAPLEAGRAVRFFEEALTQVQKAKQIFRELSDPHYLVEATSELGRINRDEAQLYRQRRVANSRIIELEEEAEKVFNEAMEMAGRHEMLAEKADAYQDLAELHFNRGTPEGYRRAEEIAIAIEGDDQKGLLPMGCVISKEPRQPECPVAAYWLVLGKARLLRGYMAFNSRQYEEAIEHWVLAYRYFENYSPTATELNATLQRLYRRLMTLSPTRLEGLKTWCVQVEKAYGGVATRIQPLFDQAIEKTKRQDVE